jgi:VanZ family protein
MNPRRVYVALWLLGWAAFGIPWTTFSPQAHWEHVRWIPFPPNVRESLNRNRLDDVLNVAYYVPLGWFGGTAGWGTGSVVAIAAALSVSTETAQLFSTERYPSTVDLITNITGAVAGLWLARRSVDRRRARRS